MVLENNGGIGGPELEGGGEPEVKDDPTPTTDFDFTGSDDDPPTSIVEEPVEDKPQDTATVQEPEVPADGKAAGEPVVVKEPVPEAVPEQPPQPVASASPPAEPEVQGLSPEQVQQQRAAALSDLTSSYQITKEEAEEFQLDPEKAVPKALANLHLRVVETTLQLAARMLQTAIPMGIEQYEQVRTANTQYEDQVTERWPELKGHVSKTSPTYKQVFGIFNHYRQQFPNAPVEEIIERAGGAAVSILGLQPQPRAPVAAPAPKPKSLPPVGGVNPSSVVQQTQTGSEFDFTNMDYE